MPVPLALAPAAGRSFRSWLLEHLGSRPLVVLDARSGIELPGIAWRIQAGRPVDSRFLGSLQPKTTPDALLAAAVRLGEGSVVILPRLGDAPEDRTIGAALLEILRPESVLRAPGAPEWWGGEEVELESAPPERSMANSRAAAWEERMVRGHTHIVPFAAVRWDGLALGSGLRMPGDVLPDAIRVERVGNRLLVVAHDDPPEGRLMYAAERSGAKSIDIVHPEDYVGRIVATVAADGREAGHGRIEAVDFAGSAIHLRVDLSPPWICPVVRVGTLRIDAEGRELGEVRRFRS